MIDVVQARSAMAATPGDIIAVPRSAMELLLGEVEVGQNARRDLVNLKTLTAIAASRSGAPR